MYIDYSVAHGDDWPDQARRPVLVPVYLQKRIAHCINWGYWYPNLTIDPRGMIWVCAYQLEKLN
jgi:hypothetical protein